VDHFEAREKLLPGKAMIVCMSRRIAVDLYHALVALRPEWDDARDDFGALKVVMTGSAGDPKEYQPHLRNKPRRKALAERFKNPADPFKLVIVRDMWLTGFDAPCLHTMYVDKPMQGHNLMQAIARVNRVFKGKDGGLIVDYLGIATDLQQAVDLYTQEGGRGLPVEDLERVIGVMLDQYSIVSGMFAGFDYRAFFTAPSPERLNVLREAMEYVLDQPDGKRRFMESVARLTKAFALAVPADETIDIREEVAFFQAVRASFEKNTPLDGRPPSAMDAAVKQLVSEAVVGLGSGRIRRRGRSVPHRGPQAPGCLDPLR